MYDSVTKKWETVQSMTKFRSRFNLLAVEGELYAVTCTTIEKLDKGLGVWRVVAEIGERWFDSGACAVGSKIYVIGGNNGYHESIAFDVITEQLSSASLSVEDRVLPRGFSRGHASTMPPYLPKYHSTSLY